MSGGCGDCEDNEIYQANMIATIKELEQKLSDSEAEMAKMRDIAEETQRKLDEAIEVIRWTTLVHDDAKGAKDFLAKIKGKY